MKVGKDIWKLEYVGFASLKLLFLHQV